MSDDMVTQSAGIEIMAKRPTTQNECCELAARVCIQLHGVPLKKDIRRLSLAGATGLFGPAFSSASPSQQRKWVLMYEAALRKEIAEHRKT